MSHTQEGNRGQVLVLIAFLMLVLIGLLALLSDVAQIVLTKRKLQTGVDLAALAGAAEFVGNPDHAAAVALDYAERNGLEPQNTTVKVNQAQRTVEVDSTSHVRLFFPFIWAYTASQVSASGVAEVGQMAVAFDYVLFSGSQSREFRMPGSRQVVDGNVHSNQNLVIPGSDNRFNQRVEIVGVLNDSQNKNTFAQLINPASVLPMPEYDVAELRRKATQVYNSNVSFSNVELNGIIFVDGDVNISGNKVRGRGTIVATGSINVSSSDFRYQTGEDLIAFYALGDHIALSGSDGHYDGIWYAPNGEIRIPGSRNTFYGSLVTQRFAMSGSDNHFIYDTRLKTIAVNLIR